MKTQFTLDAGRCIVRDGVPFASIHGVWQYDPCEVDKLARQVAALPELVAALEAMLTCDESNNSATAIYEQARAALAKVRG